MLVENYFQTRLYASAIAICVMGLWPINCKKRNVIVRRASLSGAHTFVMHYWSAEPISSVLYWPLLNPHGRNEAYLPGWDVYMIPKV